MAVAIVILGAAVRMDGSPSASLYRRALYGLSAARLDLNAHIFCTGGSAGDRPSEAAVMAEILIGEGVAPGRVVLDEQSRDTLENVVAAARFIKTHGLDRAIVCTDSYHAPRVRMLFRELGVRTEVGPVERGRGSMSIAFWGYMRTREVAAYAYDFMVIKLRGRELEEAIARE